MARHPHTKLIRQHLGSKGFHDVVDIVSDPVLLIHRSIAQGIRRLRISLLAAASKRQKKWSDFGSVTRGREKNRDRIRKIACVWFRGRAIQVDSLYLRSQRANWCGSTYLHFQNGREGDF